MASEIKVNKISPESGTTLTLGDSGDTINFGSGVLPNFENLTVTGDLTVDTNSLKVDSTNNFVGIGTASPSVALDVVGAITASGNITGTLATAAQPNITSVGTLTSFTSTGIDDNATSTAITIDSSQNVNIGGDLTSESIELNGAPNAFGTNTSSAYIFKTGSTGSAPFNQAGALLYQPRTTTTEGRSNHLFYTGSPLALRQNIHPNGDISFYEDTGTTPKFFWDASAESLGIGTSSPQTALHIDTNIPNIRLTDELTAVSANARIDLYGSDARSGYVGMVTGNLEIWNQQAKIIKFGTSNTERMRIDSSGNVGIGTSNPGYKLDVEGVVRINTASDYVLRVGSTDGYAGILLYDGSTSAVTNNQIVAIGNELRFKTLDTYRLNIDSSGNVGIGTTSPASELEIESATPEIRIDATSGAGRNYKVHSDGNELYIEGIGSSGSLKIGEDGTYGVSIDLGTGGIQASDGIYLGGTGTANKLDDYEEGTWTPTYVAGGTNFTSVTYESQVGKYTKIGDTVILTVKISTNAINKGSASGDVYISGLPFTSNELYSNGTILYNTANWSGDMPDGWTTFANISIAYLYYKSSTTAVTNINPADMGTGGSANNFIATMIYKTNA